MTDNKIQLIPDAHLLLSSLRSVGYKTETAIADIIDNCIAAKSTEIHVDFVWDQEQSYISIYDNGLGMSEEDLFSAMKIGSSDPLKSRDPNDLGRFGMGLKTASFSIGKKLRVVSKNNSKISTCCWDLDYIEKVRNGRWDLFVNDIDLNFIESKFTLFSRSNSGTLVIIENLDQLVDIEDLDRSKRNFYKTIDRDKSNISLIFHRFIEEDQLHIYFNSLLIEAWNPFVLDNSATQELDGDCDVNNQIYVYPYVLPHKSKFLSDDAFNKAGGPKGWNAHQGIYVYRNRRLIVYGTWFDIVKKEPAFNLARIRIDMNSEYDYDWKIDIKKSVATPPLYYKDRLENVIVRCTAQSAAVYNYRGTYSSKNTNQKLSFVWEQRKNNLGKFSFYLNKKHPLLNKVFTQLSEESKNMLKAYLHLVESCAPFELSGISNYIPETKLSNAGLSKAKEKDIADAKELISNLVSNNFSYEEISDLILGIPKFYYIEDELKTILKESFNV